FFYAQQTQLWIFFKVPKSVIYQEVGENLDNLGFDLASFEDDDVGYVALKPMVFMAEFGSQTAAIPGTSASTEVEFTVLVRPKGERQTQRITFSDYLNGRATSAKIGQLRLDVLCDGDVAVAAGRAKFGEHKFLGSFEYSYPTPNQVVGNPKPFSLDMTAYTFNGAGLASKKMFRIQASLQDARPTSATFSPELLFSAFPPEPQAGITQQSVGEYRYFDSRNFSAFSANRTKFKLTYGDAEGATALKPVQPFGDGQPIPGSESWPKDMVSQMKAIIGDRQPAGFLLYLTPPAEYETNPFILNP
ncbi:MAG: hypothetical protein WCO71_11125, partial [Pseudomonadota bacterium]